MFRHTQATIFVEFVESVGIPCHPIVKSSVYRLTGHKPLKNHRVFKQSAMVSPIDYYYTHMHIPINH